MRPNIGLALRVEHGVADLHLSVLRKVVLVDKSVLFLVSCCVVVSILHLLDSGRPLRFFLMGPGHLLIVKVF